MSHEPPVVGTVRRDEPLAAHTTWRVGGPADIFFVPATVAALGPFLAAHQEVPLFWLGLGSNTLVRDGGIRGAVIATAGGLGALGHEAALVYAEAGVPCAKLARFCAQSGRLGLEFLAGIPGTVGGALAMNAGAAGSQIWDYVAFVETVDRAGCVRRRPPADFRIRYRSVTGPDGEWFVSVRLSLPAGASEVGKARIREHLALRKRTQPTQTANAGSVFRNPPGDYAARLIEGAGLKGLREGGAVVSEHHANFIVNEGDARAQDIERLILRVQDRVRTETGITLEPEVCIVGEPS